MKRFLKSHRYTIILVFIFILLVILGLIGKELLVPNEGKEVYGDRLKNIEKHPIDEDIYKKVDEVLSKNSGVEKVTHRVQGKIIKYFITFNDNNTTFIKSYETDLDMNHGIRIDILPLDGCPTGRMKRRIQKFWALIYSLYSTQMVPENHGKIVSLGGKVLLCLVPIRSLRWKIVSLAEKKMTKYKIDDCKYITELCSGPKYMQNEYEKEWFDKIIYKEFEGEKMPIPIGYDSYLRMAFGDYMKLPPKEKQIPEHDVVYCDLNNSYKKYKGKYYCVDNK